jgi:hypothetical protein
LDLRGRKWQDVGEEYIMGSFITCDKVENDMDGTCSTYGRVRNVQNFGQNT